MSMYLTAVCQQYECQQLMLRRVGREYKDRAYCILETDWSHGKSWNLDLRILEFKITRPGKSWKQGGVLKVVELWSTGPGTSPFFFQIVN